MDEIIASLIAAVLAYFVCVGATELIYYCFGWEFSLRTVTEIYIATMAARLLFGRKK